MRCDCRSRSGLNGTIPYKPTGKADEGNDGNDDSDDGNPTQRWVTLLEQLDHSDDP